MVVSKNSPVSASTKQLFQPSSPLAPPLDLPQVTDKPSDEDWTPRKWTFKKVYPTTDIEEKARNIKDNSQLNVYILNCQGKYITDHLRSQKVRVKRGGLGFTEVLVVRVPLSKMLPLVCTLIPTAGPSANTRE